MIVGEVGGEAVWLNKLAKGLEHIDWMRFTPLPAILSLQTLEYVKIMHDVSEGGVVGALFEVAEAHEIGLGVSSDEIVYSEGVEELNGDILRAPTYGALILIVGQDGVIEAKKKCQEIGVPCSVIGRVSRENGLIIDGVRVLEQKRINIDEIYGSFEKKEG